MTAESELFNNSLFEELRFVELHCKILRKKLKSTSKLLSDLQQERNSGNRIEKDEPSVRSKQLRENTDNTSAGYIRERNCIIDTFVNCRGDGDCCEDCTTNIKNDDNVSSKFGSDRPTVRRRKDDFFPERGDRCSIDIPKNRNSFQQMTESFQNKQRQGPILLEKVPPLPFVAGTSTSRSYNICLNLQEVLAKFRKKAYGFINPNYEYDLRFAEGDDEVRDERGEVNVIKNADTEKSSTTNAVPVKDYLYQGETERNAAFKDILRNLYEEFTTMVQEYDALAKSYQKKMNKTELRQELRTLDMKLKNKEDEIIILIGLYGEVTTMKNKIKNLEGKGKKMASPAKLAHQLKSSESTNLRMRFLLRQINKLQELVGCS